MADRDRVLESVRALQEMAVRYRGFDEEPATFLEEIKRMAPERLQRFRSSYADLLTKKDEGREVIRPVVFVRNVLVSRILEGKDVTLEDLDEICSRVEARDTDYFRDFPSLLDAIAQQKELTKSPFTNWNHFRLLFYIDYADRSEIVQAHLREVAEYLIEELELEDCDYYPAGFNANQNFGTDWAWLALFPFKNEDHKAAYQLFVSFLPDGFEYGLYPGSELDDDDDSQRVLDSGDFDLDKVVAALRELVPDFYRLNRQLLIDGGPVHWERLPPKNVILYGPPGTGKTYSVRRRALALIDGSAEELSDAEVAERFRDYQGKGQIEFMTFHPSYSYEEFVEGFRYDPDSGIPVLKEGIFRTIVKRALTPVREVKPFEGAQIWKVSLGRADQQHIFDRCMERGEIAVSMSPFDDTDLSGMEYEEVFQLFEERRCENQTKNIRTLSYLTSEMRDGDYVAVLKDQRSIRAIGVVNGPYLFKEGEEFPHTRPVIWVDQQDHDFYELNDRRNLSPQTIHKLHHAPLQEFVKLIPSESGEEEASHVLIIDEINRGNLARIFGELITLLEPDKRLGAEHELEVRLPYSQQRFGVPSNLHVIGTMNSADRSIALLDVALRRRFDFEEMMPRVDVIRQILSDSLESEDEEEPKTSLTPELVDTICSVFETLNARITLLLDRDHQIGHSYFLGIRSPADLHTCLYRRVLPLLQEYFYNDRERLIRLLGEARPEAGRGFIRLIEGSHRDPFGGEPIESEQTPWEFHRYLPSQLEEVLRRTFLAPDEE